MRLLIAVLLLLATWPSRAQTSVSFELEEHAFNAGGRPADGAVATSGSYRVSLDAVGGAVAGAGLAGASYGMDAGFAPAYPPPGEVTNVRFADEETLVWDAALAAGSYNLYRDLVTNLDSSGYGDCQESGITTTSTSDAELPPVSDAFFYLLSVENRLSEEGTLGSDGTGAERPNSSPCP